MSNVFGCVERSRSTTREKNIFALLRTSAQHGGQNLLRACAVYRPIPPQNFRATTARRIACSARWLVVSNPGQCRKVNR